MSRAISVSTGPIFTIFSPNGRYLREFSWSGPVFLIPQGTLPWQPILWQNYVRSLHLSLCHSQTEWDIALQIHTIIAPLIALHRVKRCMKIGSVVFELKWGSKWKLCCMRHGRYWPILPNISTTTEPVFTSVSTLVDVCMQIIKLWPARFSPAATRDIMTMSAPRLDQQAVI